MNCDECLQVVWQYLDGELDHASSRRLQQHLEQCRPCLSHVEAARRLKAMVRQSCGRDRAPSDLRERLSQLLHRGQL
jgi:mycothiol system anti-sigma-R factor